MSYAQTVKRNRYNVRWITTDIPCANNTARLKQIGWEVYDWKEYKSVQKFDMGEHEQAHGLCKLMNSIEEENDGVSK